MTTASIEHEIKLVLASGADLTLRYFSDREHRWIFAYDYHGPDHLRPAPEIVNTTRLTANYEDGVLTDQIVLSMDIVIPDPLGQKFFAGLDISPGAKTYLAFTYDRVGPHVFRPQTGITDHFYQLTEICKGAIERVCLADLDPALVRAFEFPFPVPDRIPVDRGRLYVPFRANTGSIAHFDLPASTVR